MSEHNQHLPSRPPSGERLVDAPPPTAAAPAGPPPLTGAPVGTGGPLGNLGVRLEPLTRLANFAAAGVCAAAAYETLFLCGALIVFLSGSWQGALILYAAYLLFFLVLLAAAVPFVIWFHRAYGRLRQYGVATRFSPGMAIGCWFIPFANWVLPGMIGAEIWRAGQRSNSDTANLAHYWWGTYIGSGVLGALSLIMMRPGLGARAFGFWVLLSSALLLVSAGFAIAFVRRASERLDALDGLAPPSGSLDQAIRSVYSALPIPATLIGDQPGEASAVPPRPVAPQPQPAVTQPEPARLVCQRCGAAGVAGANFCGACGARAAG